MAKTQLPQIDKTSKSARKSAQVLKTNAPTKATTAKGAASKVKADAKLVAQDAKAAALDVKASAKTAAGSLAAAATEALDTEAVTARIETLKSDLAQLTQSPRENGLTYLDAKTADARAAASEKAELAKEKYAELAADTEAKIRANPLTAVAIAAGVGLIFGAISRR